MSYLVIRGMQVRAMNARNMYAAINTAPILAALGFAHYLGRILGGSPQSVGLVHENGKMLGEWCFGKWSPQQRRGSVFIDKDDYAAGSISLSSQPTASAHLTLSLVIKVEGSIRLDDAFRRFMHGARLAGGQVERFKDHYLVESEEEVRKLLAGGFWLIERQDLMQGSDPVTSLINALGTRHPAPEEGALPMSWLTPVSLGYALISPEESRAGARDGACHAFCEPLMGLTQYVSVRTYGERPLPLWRGVWATPDVYLATTQQETLP